jgi:hypothetical protein
MSWGAPEGRLHAWRGGAERAVSRALLTRAAAAGASRFVPYVGIVTILMNLYPQLKFVLLGLLGVYVVMHRE